MLTIGFVDITVAELEAALAGVAAQEQVRHDRIEPAGGADRGRLVGISVKLGGLRVFRST